MRSTLPITLLLLACALLSSAAFSAEQPTPSIAEGERLAAAGDVKGALAVYAALTEADPLSHEAFAHLGGMQLADQRYSDAIKSFQQAIALGDDSAGAFIGMGMCYLHTGRLGPARAAFVEAKAHGVRNPDELDQVIAWIDSREGDMAATLH